MLTLKQIVSSLLLSLRMQMGRSLMLYLAFALVWPLLQQARSVVGLKQNDFTVADIQNALFGFPLYIIAIVAGVSVIARECERRTLEVRYCTPGGISAHCYSHTAAIAVFLLAASALTLLGASFLVSSIDVFAIASAYVGLLFFFCLGFGLGVFIRSEVMSLLVALLILFASLFTSTNNFSPLFNYLAAAGEKEIVNHALLSRRLFALTLISSIIYFVSLLRLQKSEVMLR